MHLLLYSMSNVHVCKGETLSIAWFHEAGFIGYIQAWFDFTLDFLSYYSGLLFSRLC